MHIPSPTRRAAAILAASTAALSTAVLSAAGAASATSTPITSADNYSVSSDDAGSPTSVTINDGFCTAWVRVIGGQGGDTSGGSAGGAADEVSFHIVVTAGQQYDFHVGTAGSGSTAGTNADVPAANGVAGTGSDGGGGAGSSISLDGGAVVASAKGGDGAGTTGGTGGGTDVHDDSLLTDDGTTPFAGSTDDPTNGSGRTGNGEVEVDVEACEGPGAPDIHEVDVQDTTADVIFNPPQADHWSAAVSGYEYRLDGGTWTPVTTQWVDPNDTGPYGQRTFTLTGLTLGHTYSLEMEADSQYNGPSETSSAESFTAKHIVAAPTAFATEVSAGKIHLSWSPPAGETGITGYQAWVLPGDNPQSNSGEVDCPHMGAAARSCDVSVVPGIKYTAGVAAVTDDRGYQANVVTDVVPALSTPPAGAGAVTGAHGAKLSNLTAGQSITLSGSGYQPFTTVSLYVYSTPTLLGTVTTDASGSFSQSVTLPAGLAPGTHHLVTAGIDSSGQVRYLRTDVSVATPANQLAWTGFETLPYAGAGVLAVLLGVGLVFVGRRRRTA